MGKCIEKTGKTVQEAIDAALEELGLSEDQVSVEIINESSKAMLGIFGGKEAKVLVTVISAEDSEDSVIEDYSDEDEDYGDDEEYAEKKDIAYDFLMRVFQSTDVDADIDMRVDEEGIIRVDIQGDKNAGMFIGRKGEAMDALQLLTNIVTNKDRNYKKVCIDIGGYRAAHDESLRKLAERMADKAVKTKTDQMLDPMNAYERRIVHMVLQDMEHISTYSTGEEPYRKTVIVYEEN
jgi:spoIIIJ-associated protein